MEDSPGKIETEIARAPGRPRRPPQHAVRTGFRVGAEPGLLDPLPLGRLSLIITGVARGGTSFAASVCHHLGVNLGRGGPRYEDRKLARRLLDGRFARLRARMIAERDPATAFGWKLPALNFHLDDVAVTLPEARFIFILRDPVAVALRKQIAPETMGDPLGDTLTVIRATERMWSFAHKAGRPCLLLSYEKGANDPIAAIRDLGEFIGQEVTDEGAYAIAAAVAWDQTAYRSAAKTDVETPEGG